MFQRFGKCIIPSLRLFSPLSTCFIKILLRCGRRGSGGCARGSLNVLQLLHFFYYLHVVNFVNHCSMICIYLTGALHYTTLHDLGNTSILVDVRLCWF